jgi:hypothetical protein
MAWNAALSAASNCRYCPGLRGSRTLTCTEAVEHAIVHKNVVGGDQVDCDLRVEVDVVGELNGRVLA